MNSKDLIRRLKSEGWIEVHVKGSHHKFKHPSQTGHVALPHPKRDLPIGTLRELLQSSNWKQALAKMPGYAPHECGEVLSLRKALPWWNYARPRISK